MWDPTHRSNPAVEFAKYKQKFVVNGEGKSKGIKLQFEYPLSWTSLEAERPNIVRKFVSERGRGFESAMVIVNSIPPGDQLSKREIDEAFSTPAGIRELAPPGSTFLSGKRVSFDGLPGAMVTYRMAADRMGQQIRTRFLMYMTLFRDKVITIQFSTMDDDATFARFDPLFRLMANSTVILGKYEPSTEKPKMMNPGRSRLLLWGVLFLGYALSKRARFIGAGWSIILACVLAGLLIRLLRTL